MCESLRPANRKDSHKPHTRFVQFPAHRSVVQCLSKLCHRRFIVRTAQVHDASLRPVLMQAREHLQGGRQRVVAGMREEKHWLSRHLGLPLAMQVQHDTFGPASGYEETQRRRVSVLSRLPACAAEGLQQRDVRGDYALFLTGSGKRRHDGRVSELHPIPLRRQHHVRLTVPNLSAVFGRLLRW